jgi:hypothetical protein
MPLDGSNFVIPAQQMLDAAATAAGIEPLSPDFLDRHKHEQLRLHPASLAYRHHRPIELALAIILVTGVIGFFVLFSAQLPIAGCASGAIGLLAAVGPMLVPVRGPSRWRERIATDLLEVHPAVREKARALRQHFPDADFVVGELFQERVKLDPYLVAEFYGGRIVLGIWDGDRLIACA